MIENIHAHISQYTELPPEIDVIVVSIGTNEQGHLETEFMGQELVGYDLSEIKKMVSRICLEQKISNTALVFNLCEIQFIV